MLQVVKTIEPQSWMRTPAVLSVLKALDGALFVGGCVRNALLGRPVFDIDIATIRTPEEVQRRLNTIGVKTIPTGIEHGTVTAVQGEYIFEITTLRKDVETDGRRAVVSFTRDWREDAQRRDFTMNTLLADSEGHVYDPTGWGLHDLEKGRVRFVGHPADRIAEDYLRILRFFRFHAYYGRGEPDQAALAACRAAADKIVTLSKERITQEFFKIVMACDPVSILSLMFTCGVLKELAAENCQMALLTPDTSLETRLLVLAGFDDAVIGQMEQWLIFSKAQKRQIKNILGAYSESKKLDEKNAKILIYRHGRDVAQQVFILRGYDGTALKDWDIPRLPLTGDDVKAAGIAQGKAVGAVLREIEGWWLAQGFAPDRDACLLRLKAISLPGVETSK